MDVDRIVTVTQVAHGKDVAKARTIMSADRVITSVGLVEFVITKHYWHVWIDNEQVAEGEL